MSSVQIRNYSLLNAGENVPMGSLGVNQAHNWNTYKFVLSTASLCQSLPNRGEMKITSFTVIRNSSEGALSGDAVGEWYLASIKSWSLLWYLTPANLSAAFPFHYLLVTKLFKAVSISSGCTLYRRITFQYFPERLLLLSTQKSKPASVDIICS